MTAEQVEVRKVSPVRFVLPAEATIFAGQDVAEFPFPVVPFIAPVVDLVSTRRRLAGRAFQRARENRGITKNQLRTRFRGQTGLVSVFESGQAPMSLDHALSVAEQKFQGEDYDLRELRDHTEDEKWIRTLTKPGMTIGRAVKLLRLYNLQTKVDFAKDASINKVNLSQIELGHIEPKAVTLNQIIEASSIDPDGIPAQIIRLIREKRDPMSLMELQNCTFGELARYIRQLKGLSTQRVGSLFRPRKASGNISYLERSKTITDKKLGRQLITHLNVNPKSALAEIFRRKLEEPKTRIPEALLTQVFTGNNDGQFVFAEHIYETAHFPQEKPEKLISQLDTIKDAYANSPDANYVVNAMLTFLRKQNKITQVEVTKNREMFIQVISRVENNEVIPTDVTIIKILNGLGYDIHDPITSYMLDIAESIERRLS